MNLSIKKCCKVCSAEFENSNGRATLCSISCKKEQLRRNNVISYRKKNAPLAATDTVICEICNVGFKSLPKHIKFEHGMSVEVYKEQYPAAKIISENFSNLLSDKITGENNPGYGHGGRLSPWSDKSIHHSAEQVIQECMQFLND